MTKSLPASVRQCVLDETLSGELVEPDDIATVTYLGSPGGHGITRQILRVWMRGSTC